MERSTFRVLVVDDYELWRSFLTRTLQKKPELQVIGEASDGLEAVQKAQQLQPDLILLDIGLPTFNGIAAARRILHCAPKTKILFVSELRSSDIVKEALGTGARGYVVKSKAATELWPAVEAVLEGEQFISPNLTGSAFGDPEIERTARDPRGDKAALTPTSNAETACHHEVGFYSDELRLLDDVTRFVGAVLRAGNAAIVVASESHRNSLLRRLQAYGLDTGAAIEQGRYVTFDAANTLATFMVNELPDPTRFFEAFGSLITTAAKVAKGKPARVAVFGECVHLLWAQGNVEAAIQMEKLGNQLVKTYDVDILCGYSLGSVEGGMDSHTIQQICAQHSAVYSH